MTPTLLVAAAIASVSVVLVFYILTPLTVLWYIALGGVVISFVLAKKSRGLKTTGIHGSARWGDYRVCKKAGLTADYGVVLGLWGAMYSGNERTGYALRKRGKLVIQGADVPRHILGCAQTRGGKGISLVFPTIVRWPGSMIIYDPKRELWEMSSEHRHKMSHALRFEPASANTARWNCINEIRPAPHDVQDAQIIANILVDVDSASGSEKHWVENAQSLLTTCILHVYYSGAEKSLRGVDALINDPDPDTDIFKTLETIRDTQHLGDKAHPAVALGAQEMLNKENKELSSIVSTAVRALTVYRDEIVAAATRQSDFSIQDILRCETPVTVYIVISLEDLSRLKSLIRIFVALAVAAVMRSSEEKPHKLLFLLDEFPLLGKLDIIEKALAVTAGLGAYFLLIIQSLSQLKKVYGHDNSILSNTQTKLFLGAADIDAAEYISKLMGRETVVAKSKSLSSNSDSTSLSEQGKNLIDSAEVLKLPYTDVLLFVAGQNPLRLKKVMYYLNTHFSLYIGKGRGITDEEEMKTRKVFNAQAK